MNIRKATVSDVGRMVELSEEKRIEYAEYSPVFWRKADDSAEKQAPFLSYQIEQERNIVLVAEADGAIVGFVIASIGDAPPVYNPGGKVCMVDDFTVSEPALWPTVGRELVSQAFSEAKSRGAVLLVVCCGRLDEPKRSALAELGLEIASEWFVGSIA